MKLLFDNCDQDVRSDSAPDLRFHCVLAVADEALDTKVLLDPLEEQLDLPTAFVQRRNSERRQGSIVGQEHQGISGFRVFEADAPQLLGVVPRDVVTFQDNALVADDARAAIGRHRVHPARIHAALGSCHKERRRLMQCEQASEIQIPAIHDIERTGFEGQHVEHIDLVHLAVRDMDEGWDIASQVQQRVELDCGLGGAKRRPWKQRQAQVDGCGIQGVHRVGQLDAEALVAVQLACSLDQQRRQIGPDMPVAAFVGIGQCRAFDGRSEAHAVEFRLASKQVSMSRRLSR